MPARADRRSRILIGLGATVLIAGGVYYYGWLKPRLDDPVRALMLAAERADARFVEGRLQDFAHRPFKPSDRLDRDRLAVRGAALRVAQSAGTLAARQRAAGHLLAGNTRAAIRELELTVASDPRDDAGWNDLAVALIEAGRAGDAEALPRALAAAERAQIIDPASSAARYNYGVALLQMNLKTPALQAFKESLRTETVESGATETRGRIHSGPAQPPLAPWRTVAPRLEQAIVARETSVARSIISRYKQQSRGQAEVEFLADWAEAKAIGDESTAARKLSAARFVGEYLREVTGDSLLHEAATHIAEAAPRQVELLGRAHVLYRRARKLQHERKPTAALPLFREAESLFRRADSPMQNVATYWIANCLSDGAAADVALATIRRMRVPDDHKSLRGLLAWQEATILNGSGYSSEALGAYERAFSIFDNIGDTNSATYMLNAIAAMHRNLGRTTEAWRVRYTAFERANDSGQPDLLQMVVHTAARSECAAGDFHVGHALLGIAAELPTSNPRLSVDAPLWRGLAANRLGLRNAAERDLKVARMRVALVSDATLRASVENDLRLAEAMVTVDDRQSIARWTEYIQDAARRRDNFLLPNALVERSRAYRRLRQLDLAKADLKSALEEFERRGGGIAAPDYRDRYFASLDEVVRELVDLVDQTEGAVNALTTSERWRDLGVIARGAAARDWKATGLLPAVPVRHVVARYIVLDDRLLIFSISAGRIRHERIAIARSTLEKLIASFAGSVQSGRLDRGAAKRLYQLLLSRVDIPAAGALAIMADPVLDALPFAALIDPADSRYLVEKVTLTFLVGLPRLSIAPRPGANHRHASALVVGNPAFDARRFELPGLPGAEAEARDIGQLYAVQPLLGRSASKDRVIAGLQASRVVHLAAHAVANMSKPDESFVVLATAPDGSSALYLHEIARLSLDHVSLAVIAGCQTARSTDSPRVFRNLAASFVAAGARNALGALWDLDDAAARRVSVGLHRRVIRGTGVADALREVQVELLRSKDPRLSTPSNWAALRLYGQL